MGNKFEPYLPPTNRLDEDNIVKAALMKKNPKRKKYYSVDKEERRRSLKNKLISCTLIIAVLFTGILLASHYIERERITSYEVAVVPEEHGDMTVSYRIKWKVVNDFGSPVKKVKIKMPNSGFTILGYGGSVKGADPANESIYHAVFILNKAYRTGETAEINFTVRQSMLLGLTPPDRSKPAGDYYYCAFTPGYFRNIAVDSYRFTWENSSSITDKNCDRTENNFNIWEGALGKNERREMNVVYEKGFYDFVYYSQIVNHEYNLEDRSLSQRSPLFSRILTIIYFILILAVAAGLIIFVGVISGEFEKENLLKNKDLKRLNDMAQPYINKVKKYYKKYFQ